MKIAAIIGSLREHSYNLGVINTLEGMLPEEINISYADLKDIPMFNEDIEHEKIDSVINLKKLISESDLIVISTPEYNSSIPAVLKNALDWASRDEEPPFKNKQVAIMSASISRFGALRAQDDLRKVLFALGANVLNYPEIYITDIEDKVDKNGLIIDERTKRALSRLVDVLKTKL